MADGFSISMLTGPFNDSIAEMNRVTDKATMYGLRTVGRTMQKAIKPKVPVYSGTDPRAQAESGNLKKSVRNSKRLVKVGVGDYSLKVGPFGTKKAGTAVTRHGSGSGQIRGVQLYRAAQEVRHGYMATGVGDAQATVKTIYEAAYSKAWARFA
jgi:hypothetical protein